MQAPEKPHQLPLPQKQLDLAGILAAAVHQGYVSVQEGICDALDHFRGESFKDGQPTKLLLSCGDRAQLPRLIAERYLDPDAPGECLLACQLLMATLFECAHR